MDNSNDWIIVGRFGRPQGLKGLIRVISFTADKQNILNYLPWHYERNKQWIPLKLVRVELQHQHILVEIEGYSLREQLAILTNSNIAIKREILPNLTHGEYYWHELVGMTVVTVSGALLGTVAEIIATGSNDVLVVLGEKRHLIPYLPDIYVMKIDNEMRQITVDWDVDF